MGSVINLWIAVDPTNNSMNPVRSEPITTSLNQAEHKQELELFLTPQVSWSRAGVRVNQSLTWLHTYCCGEELRCNTPGPEDTAKLLLQREVNADLFCCSLYSCGWCVSLFWWSSTFSRTQSWRLSPSGIWIIQISTMSIIPPFTREDEVRVI